MSLYGCLDSSCCCGLAGNTLLAFLEWSLNKSIADALSLQIGVQFGTLQDTEHMYSHQQSLLTRVGIVGHSQLVYVMVCMSSLGNGKCRPTLLMKQATDSPELCEVCQYGKAGCENKTEHLGGLLTLLYMSSFRKLSPSFSLSSLFFLTFSRLVNQAGWDGRTCVCKSLVCSG